MNSVFILGATSDIGMAIAERFASSGHSLALAARDHQRLAPLKEHLKIKYGTDTILIEYDAEKEETYEQVIQKAADSKVFISTIGYLGSQEKAIRDASETYRQVLTNYLGIMAITNEVIKGWKPKQGNSIIGLSSVAAERGRMSNFTYGSAKAGYSIYLAGLRNHLFHQGAHVMTVKLGFVDTKMTKGLDLPKLLTTTPQRVANVVYRNYLRKKNIVYILPIWRIIMFIIKLIPESIFKRLKL